jgi:hypothetical protein
MTEPRAMASPSASGKRILLGEGVLEVAREERGTGRWGSVMLNVPGNTCASYPGAPEGTWGALRAIVQRIPAGIVLRTPWRAGEEVALGSGYLFTTEFGGFPAVGVRPHNATHAPWLHQPRVESLLHMQVALVFDPDPVKATLRLDEEAEPAVLPPDHPARFATQPARATSEQLGAFWAEYYGRLSQEERDAIVIARGALTRIAVEDRHG